MRRDPAKATAVLDAMLEFFDGGQRWTRGILCDEHRHRCLVGALRHVRRQEHIRGSGAEYYLRQAMLTMSQHPGVAFDIFMHLRSCYDRPAVLESYNDTSAGYHDVRSHHRGPRPCPSRA
jgi:hypothetical protein